MKEVIDWQGYLAMFDEDALMIYNANVNLPPSLAITKPSQTSGG